MTSIISVLQHLLETKQDAIEAWFARAYAGHDVPFYSSVDVRYAGHKIAPVDTNLFPAGFNNLSESGKARAIAACTAYMQQHHAHAKTIALVSENHTRNMPYFANIAMLKAILEACGMTVHLTRFDLAADEQTLFPTLDGSLLMEGMRVMEGNITTASGSVPDIIVLNNDLSVGYPDILCNINQPVIPHPSLGWFVRRKTTHFTAYNQLIASFCAEFGVDSWLMSTLIHRCGKIDFKERTGLECVALGVDKMIFSLRQKHAEYGISREPYVYIKADSGTYGMGIMTARSGDEVMEINKRERNKMNVIKEGVKNNEVIIQEGVPTIDTIEGRAAEPLIYLMGGAPIDIFWRSNAERDDEISLNAAGMQFNPFEDAAFSKSSALHVIGRIASLATAYEDYSIFEK